MKRSIVLALCIGALTLVALLFQRPGPPLPSLAPPLPSAAVAKSESPKSSRPRNNVASRLTNSATGTAVQAGAAAQQGTGRTVFDDFAQWAGQFGNSPASVVEGEGLARKRREAMLELIPRDPARALALAAPFDWRQRLPPQVARFFEEQVDGRGDFKVAVGTDFEQGTTTVLRSVQIGGDHYQAFVYGRRLAQPCQNGIPLHGVALEGKIAVQEDPLRILTSDEAAALSKKRGRPIDEICGVSGQSAGWRHHPVFAENGGGICCFCGTDHYDLVNRQWALAENGATAASGDVNTNGLSTPINDDWTHGAKSLLFMRVNFPDDLSEPISEGEAYAVMDEVNSYYTANSYNLTSLDTTVAPLVTLPQTKAYYSADPGLLLTDARQATVLAGFDTANYDRDIVAFTTVPGYTFGGLAYVGGKGVWLQSIDAGVTAHELGHNYGLWHANFWDATTNASGCGPGTNLEYGNIYDTMGAAGAGIYQFNAAHKNILDWLKADAVQIVGSNGVYRIYPLDAPARVDGRFYAALVRKDFMRNYWLEFRNLFTGNPWLQNGVLLNWAPWPLSHGGTSLIDTTPGSPNSGDSNSREDAAVVVGRTFNDNAGGVHITTLARGATGTDPYLDVQVNLGSFPGNRPPELTVDVDQTNVAPNVPVHFQALASDPDGDTLAYSWTFDDLSFSTNNLPWTSRSWNKTGDHVVRCVVSDMKGGEASANVLVTVGAAGGFRLSGRVVDTNGYPIEGVLVSNGSNTLADFSGGYTDSDGRYIIANVKSSFTLNAVQWGCTFTATTNWTDPIPATNDVTNADFVGIPLPAVNITADTNAVLENDGAAHYFTVTRPGTNGDLTVQFHLSGSATLGTDYTLEPAIGGGSLTIPAGSSNVTFTFHAVNPALAGTEDVTLTIVDDTNYSAPGYALAPLAAATITILDNNPAPKPAVTVTAATPEISESGMDSGEFVFARDGAAQHDLLVNYSVGGTGRPGTDYAPLAGVVLIGAGQSSATVFLQPLDNHAAQSNKTVAVTVAANAAYNPGSPSLAAITILNDDAVSVTVFPIVEPAVEPSSPGVFTVKRDGDLTDALVVNYNVSGPAVAGVDYLPLNGAVTIPAGADSAQVVLTPMNDAVFKPNNFVTLVLSNEYNYEAGTPGSATIFIAQSQLPTVTIIAAANSISEQGTNFGRFVVSRNTSSGNLAVYLAFSGTAVSGFNYLPLDNPVVIPNGSTSVTLDVIPFQNLILETNETVEVNLETNSDYNVGAPDNATVQILDDGLSQTPGVGFCFATSAFVESLSPGIAVGLSITSSVPVSVDYKVIGGTAPGSRYSLPQGTLTISPSNWVGFIPLQIVNDNVVEPPQTVEVALFNPVNATLGGIKVHTYTILDDDLVSVSVTATVPNASQAGPAPGNFRVTRTGSVSASQLVNFQVTGTASAPTDYAPLGTSVTIPAGAAYVDLPVTPVNRVTAEIARTVVLTLISTPGGAIVSPGVATVTISNDETNPAPLVAVSSTNHPYAVEGGGNGEFLFTRAGSTNGALTIAFAIGGTAAAGVRYMALPNSVTIPAGQSSVSLPVVAIDDSLVEGEQTVILSLTEGNTYRVADPSAATVTIQDNDQNVWINASAFAASKFGYIPGQFTFSRFGTTNTPVTVYYAISGTARNGVDYVRVTNSVVIPAGQSAVTLAIMPIDNMIVEGPVTVTLMLQANAAYYLGAPMSGTVTIDDDMPMLTLSAVVTNVLEGSGSNGVFRLTRTGDPRFDFTARIAVGGTATYGVNYPAFLTNIYFSCGVLSIDLYVAPTNNLVAEGDETVTAALLPDPAYTILSPSNALLTINDAGTNPTPVVTITSPLGGMAYLAATNIGLVLDASVSDDGLTNTLAWSEVSGPAGYTFSSTNTNNTTIFFTNAGIYTLRLTADTGQEQGSADVTAFVADDLLTSTNALHWSFDEGAGSNVLDSSGARRTGVLAGSPAWTTNGVLGGALNFFGADDCARQTRGTNFMNGLRQFTLSLWVKTATANLDGGFFAGDDAGTNQTLELGARTYASCGRNTNVIEVTVPTTEGIVHRVSASDAIKPTLWEHVAVTWSNGLAPSLYINGKPDQPMTGMVRASGMLTNCPQFIVGKGSADSPSSWNGTIDDVRFFPRALGADEIQGLYGWAVSNHAPVPYDGSNVTVQLNIPVTLTGTFTDDGLPDPPAFVTTTWSFTGTNDVSIPDPSSLTNTLVFTDATNYVFQFTTDDGQAATFSPVTVTAIEPTEVDIYADIPDAYELGPVPGEFTLTRNGDTNDLTVYLAISGAASNGVDYITLTNVVSFATGVDSIVLPVTPILDYAIKGFEPVIVTIVSNIAYSIGTGQATVNIHDSPYGEWSIAHFTLEQLTHPELSGPAADFDHDGIPNFAEYAFNLDPKAPDANPPYTWDFESSPDDGLRHFTLTYARRLPPRDVEYGVFVSTDLRTWNSGSNYVQEFSSIADTNGITETVKTRALMPLPGSTNLFVKIGVWLQQVPSDP